MTTQILVYRRYSYLTINGISTPIKFPSGARNRTVNVRCDCGNSLQVLIGNLKSGRTKSCGCKNKAKTKHGLSQLPEYEAWISAKNRCEQHTNTYYYNYGGRGIKMCQEWSNSFEQFYRDMGHKPSRFHSLERINNELGYSKENCKWATSIEQNNNTRRCINYMKGEVTL